MGTIKIVGWAFALVLFGLNASALVELSALAGYSNTMESISTSPSPTVTGKGAFSYGAQVDVKFPESSLGLGVGLWAVTATAEEAVSGFYDLTFAAPYLQVPVTVRYNLADIFSLGVGMYYAFPAGNVNTTGTLLGAPVNQSNSFSNANFKNDDYGIVADAAVYIPIGMITSITGRLIYEDGLENVSTASGSTDHNNELIILAGLAFGI